MAYTCSCLSELNLESAELLCNLRHLKIQLFTYTAKCNLNLGFMKGATKSQEENTSFTNFFFFFNLGGEDRMKIHFVFLWPFLSLLFFTHGGFILKQLSLTRNRIPLADLRHMQPHRWEGRVL